jgi:mRNA interferase MazF
VKDYLFKFFDWCKVQIMLWKKDGPVLFDEREIWWCRIGLNVGTEIFGKGNQLARPVLIFKKFNGHSFLAIPLTTKNKEGIWYVPVAHGGNKRIGILSQVRTLDSRRLISRIGTLSDTSFADIQLAFDHFYCSLKILTPPDETGLGGKSQ